MGKYTDRLNKKLRVAEKTDYVREQYQSYMTGPEWRNVEMAEEFARFLQEGKSIFRFPYFRQIFDLWKVVFQSYSAARKYNGSLDILSSEYALMDVFVGFFTTMELAPKGFLSLLLRPFLNSDNPTDVQKHIAAYYAKYARDLQTIPFYDQKYDQIRQQLAQAYRDAHQKTWGDWFTWKCVSMELTARTWLSKPLSYWFHTEDNLVAPTTDVLVKLRCDEDIDDARAKDLFRQKLGHTDATLVNDHVYVKQPDPERNRSPEDKKKHTSVYALLKVSRYAAFQPTLKSLSHEGIHVRKLAGQDHVQIKCTIDAANAEQLQQRQAALNTATPDARAIYSYGDGIHPNRRFCLFDAPVKDLHATVDALNAVENTQVKFIHNF